MTIPIWLKLLTLFWLTNFFLHFSWELLQLPFYENMVQAKHGAAVWKCTMATVGDTGIALIAYLCAAISKRSASWIYPLTVKPLLVYFLVGIIITVILEYLATGVLNRWEYSNLMPTLPLLGTGLLPLAQWIIIPALSLGSTRLMYLGLLYSRELADEDRL